MNININLIINRIKLLEGLQSETDLAKFLEITTARFANWRKRESLNWDEILTKCKRMDYNILIKGSTTSSNNSEEFKKLLAETEYFFRRTLELGEELKDFKSKKAAG